MYFFAYQRVQTDNFIRQTILKYSKKKVKWKQLWLYTQQTYYMLLLIWRSL